MHECYKERGLIGPTLFVQRKTSGKNVVFEKSCRFHFSEDQSRLLCSLQEQQTHTTQELYITITLITTHTGKSFKGDRSFFSFVTLDEGLAELSVYNGCGIHVPLENNLET